MTVLGDATPRSLTRAVVDRVRPLRFDLMPEPVRRTAVHCVLDVVGVAVVGSTTPPATLVRAEMFDERSSGPAGVVGDPRRLPAAAAALVNGTAAHALDFDDVSAAMGGHPSTVVLPAALAAAERHGLDGPEMLAAFVAGVETACLVGRLMGPEHYARGFHTTATVGAVGAAATAAHAAALDEDGWCRALGIAATRAAGLKSMFGTMTKPLHAGFAAETGVRAASLAARGFTAHRDVLGAEQGFREVLGGTGVLPPEGAFDILDVLFKRHASCFLTHSSVEGLLRLREQGLRADEVEAVRLRVPPGHLRVCAIPDPTTPLEAKFSLRHTAALALVTGDLSERSFTAESPADPRLAAVRERVDIVARADDSPATEVRVRRRHGPELVAEVDVSVPDPATPSELDRREVVLRRKLLGLVEPHVGADRTARMLTAIEGLPTARTLDDLRAAVAV
ncbi:MmgE/PrpD family protein [Pseudonocardia xishanensis]|uniref:MmgE/PrpD family protein n=1 Tax=Pseudonocardia xishanensis TaxID=630995 RepID=A0ABP8RTL2_9PSEU